MVTPCPSVMISPCPVEVKVPECQLYPLPLMVIKLLSQGRNDPSHRGGDAAGVNEPFDGSAVADGVLKVLRNMVWF